MSLQLYKFKGSWAGRDVLMTQAKFGYLQCSVLHDHAQHLTIEVTSLTSQLWSDPLLMSFVYASSDPVTREELWSELLHISASTTRPWLLAGEFNVVCTQAKKLGGNPINVENVNDFKNMIQVAIFERLDRILLNCEWKSTFVSRVSHLNRNCSDHRPLLLEIALEGGRTGSCFQFLNIWTKHHQFKTLKNDEWAQPEHGRPMIQFC